MHKVTFDKIKSTIELCNSKEMYFRDGRGNTFISILVSTYTGVHKKNIFNVMPYAKIIENKLFYIDKAFDLEES